MCALNKKGMSLRKQLSHIILLIKAKPTDVLWALTQTILEPVAIHISDNNHFWESRADPYHVT